MERCATAANPASRPRWREPSAGAGLGVVVRPLPLSFVVAAVILGGMFVGMLLRTVLPAYQLSGDSKDVVRLGTGLIGTMGALVLGLLIASAKSFYDTQNS